jgi:hypothetical protein
MIDLGTPDYLPFELDPANGRVTLLRLNEAEYRAASFLDQRMLRPDSTLVETDWAALSLPADARRDVQYIFHIGNVGSTLISRLLGECEGFLALREPMLLRNFADAEPPWRAPRFDALSAVLSRTFRPEQRALIKATSFTSELAPELVRPGSKALLLYTTADRYLENILAGEASRQELHHLGASRAERLCRRLGDRPQALSTGESAALSWACEMTALLAAAQALPEGSTRWLDFDSFLQDPATMLANLAAFFGQEVDRGQARRLAESPIMTRYSKAPEHAYSPSLRAEVLAQSRRENAKTIAEGKAWLADAASRHPAIAQCLDLAE